MSAHTVETLWMGGIQFNAVVEGHTIILDAPERAGGTDAGPVPKPLILTAFSGCTGMDVVSLLRKKDISLSSFEMKVTGELTKSQPMTYAEIHLSYIIKGEEADQEAVLQAILKSQNELCGVAAMLKRATLVSWDAVFNDVSIADSRLEFINS